MPTLRLLPPVSSQPGHPTRTVSDRPGGPARPVEPLWRELVGDRLRRRRVDRGERLVDTAARAGVSPQYLSEVERGLKDPSSEVLAAVAGALELTLVALTAQVSTELTTRSSGGAASGPVLLAA